MKEMDGETRLRVALHALDHGTASARNTFTQYYLPESSVRSWRNKLLEQSRAGVPRNVSWQSLFENYLNLKWYRI